MYGMVGDYLCIIVGPRYTKKDKKIKRNIKGNRMYRI